MAPFTTNQIAAIREHGAAVDVIADGERLGEATIGGVDAAGQRLEAVDWTDCVVERCRFSGAVMADAHFQRVVFHDCDFTGLTFANCLLRDCIVIGVRSKSHLVLDNCILDGLTLARSSIDSFEVQGCRVATLSCLEVSARRLVFQHCWAPKRATSCITLDGGDLQQVSGLDGLAQAGIGVRVDAALWRDMGDALLRERGVEELDASVSDELAELSNHLRAG